jgi:hypothetical protein
MMAYIQPDKDKKEQTNWGAPVQSAPTGGGPAPSGSPGAPQAAPAQPGQSFPGINAYLQQPDNQARGQALAQQAQQQEKSWGSQARNADATNKQAWEGQIAGQRSDWAQQTQDMKKENWQKDMNLKSSADEVRNAWIEDGTNTKENLAGLTDQQVYDTFQAQVHDIISDDIDGGKQATLAADDPTYKHGTVAAPDWAKYSPSQQAMDAAKSASDQATALQSQSGRMAYLGQQAPGASASSLGLNAMLMGAAPVNTSAGNPYAGILEQVSGKTAPGALPTTPVDLRQPRPGQPAPQVSIQPSVSVSAPRASFNPADSIGTGGRGTQTKYSKRRGA